VALGHIGELLHEGLRLLLARVGGNRRPADVGSISGAGRLRRQSIHANTGECRNIGDVRDFIRLYRYTGQDTYLQDALRLFRELRTKLSAGHLFDQGGKPLDPDPPFIDEDKAGLKVGYAKPYIIGYALAGLPELIPFARTSPISRKPSRRSRTFWLRR